ncbi:MAG: tryptophan 7-halogenase [Steroidobacter sp.]
MSSQPINDVIIAGRDAALWLSACVLQTALKPSHVRVTAIELPTHLLAPDAYATLPALEALHNLLVIDEAALLGATRGAFSFGQNFAAAPGKHASFFHAYGAYGAPVDQKAFFPHWLRARSFGLQVALEDFSLTAAAAKHGRMLIPDAATETYGRTDYGYHLPALDYVRVLRRLAQRRGVVIHQAMAIGCTLDAHTGAISAVTLDDNSRIEGQLFIDATGPEALLIGSALHGRRESWREYFPVDQMVVASGKRFSSIPPYAEIRACENGWGALHPGRSRTHVLQAYSSALCSMSAAVQATANVSGLILQDAAIRICDPGVRASAWERNCVAIGGAACTFDPVHSVDLHAVQMALVNFLSLFPVASEYSAERIEFNRVSRLGFERLRDFQSAYYRLNRYGDSAFWRHARESRISAELAHKIETFTARGEVPLYEHETFALESWLALFIGHGLVPETHDPMADRTPPETMRAELRRILGFIKDKVLEQTTHDSYLQSVCDGARRP